MSNKNVSSNVKLRQSSVDDRTQVNNRGDKVINLGSQHAIINDRHVHGESNISKAISDLLKR